MSPTQVRAAWSLQRELLVGLLVPLLLVVGLSAVAGAHLWDAWADGVFDADDLLAVAMLLLLPAAAVGVVALAVRRTVRRVERLGQGWQAHARASLEPMGVEEVPVELRPFAVALNDQLARTRALVKQERQFCENASHQLRTPLAALELGLSRAASAADLATARSAIADLVQATRRTSRIVEQLLVMARVDVQRSLPVEQVPADLRSIAHEVGSRYLDAASGKGVELALQAPPSPVTVRAQPDLLAEALANLVDNALRHTPRNGTVTIEVAAEPPELRVVDDGPGIDPAQAARLFERFARGHGGGSGLGLAIARDIARLHGGDLRLERHEGGGTTARLVLPGA